MDLEMKIIVPLAYFTWGGQTFKITDYLSIERKEKGYCPEFLDGHEFLSEHDRQKIQSCVYWLIIEDNFPKIASDDIKSSLSQLINIAATALWIVAPMGATPLFRFKGKDPEWRYFTQFMDEFRTTRYDSQMNAETSQLEELVILYPKLVDIRQKHERLNSALTFTFRACLEISWSVSFVCYFAALETILHNKMKTPLHGQLSMGAGLVLGETQEEYHEIRKKVLQLYEIRSDILHGKVYTWNDSEQNLQFLGELTKLTRKIWRKVILDEAIFKVFQSELQERTDWLISKQERLLQKFKNLQATS